ncbi:MAG: hypothetical protein DMD45_02460 [Gemmatimonadetes bacterium]|nr:MAG: hypothetical protein DMD45_02460 [Gemmatimonadota bacterium]
MATMFLVALVQHPTSPADTAGGRPCTVEIDSVRGKAQQVEVRKGETNVFAGGGVFAHCRGTGSSLRSDSVAWYAGVGRFDMIGQKSLVHIRDTAITLDAVTAAYFLRQERLEAHKNVVAVNRNSGSVLRGPNLTYYRAVKGVRDTLETYATGRPTIDYRAAADSGEPYVIVADRVRFKGNDRMWGGGTVTIDRSDFAARGDSMQLDQGTGVGLLLGKPRVEGKGTEAYTLTGTRIELGLQGRDLRLVKALGNGVATGADWRLTADTIHLHLDQKKLQQTFAWGPKDSVRARAVSSVTTILADSLALDVPDQVLTEARAFGHALSTLKRDSTATRDSTAKRDTTPDWIAGDSLTARWAQEVDPPGSGRPKSKLHRLVSRGSGRVFTHQYNQRDSLPSLNYSRGAMIDITLAGGKIDNVTVTGRADGVQLEPLPPAPPDTTKKPPETTKKRPDTTKKPKAPVR